MRGSGSEGENGDTGKGSGVERNKKPLSKQKEETEKGKDGKAKI